jgi:homopolymeric O-antigen transport system permease protein
VSASSESILVILPSRAWFRLDLTAVRKYRELLYFLVWPDLRVRYKQTAIGATCVTTTFNDDDGFYGDFGRFPKIPKEMLRGGTPLLVRH